MPHTYCRDGKFKNVNCPFALVGGRVFGSIFEAEQYCTDHTLDPNTWVESGSPEALARCKEIAKQTMPMLELWQEQMSAEYSSMLDKATREVNELRAAQAKKEIGWEVHQQRVNEIVGAIHGYNKAQNYLNQQWETLFRILQIEGYTEE